VTGTSNTNGVGTEDNDDVTDVPAA